MSIIDKLKIAGMAVGLQFYAPILVADLPSLQSLKITSIKHRPRGKYGDSYERLAHGYFTKELKDEPECLIIKGISPESSGRGLWVLGINLDRTVVGYADWSQLFGSRHGGSGDIGVVLLGLPGIIASLPILIPWWLGRSTLSKFTGMDLHQLVCWLKLRGQLPEEWRDVVKAALLNENNGVTANYWEEKRAEYDAEMEKERAKVSEDEAHQG